MKCISRCAELRFYSQKVDRKKYVRLPTNPSSFLTTDMPRKKWKLKDEIRNMQLMGVPSTVFMLSNNVTGRPASKKSYHASAVMDEGHETDKPQR